MLSSLFVNFSSYEAGFVHFLVRPKFSSVFYHHFIYLKPAGLPLVLSVQIPPVANLRRVKV